MIDSDARTDREWRQLEAKHYSAQERANIRSWGRPIEEPAEVPPPDQYLSRPVPVPDPEIHPLVAQVLNFDDPFGVHAVKPQLGCLKEGCTLPAGYNSNYCSDRHRPSYRPRKKTWLGVGYA